MLLTNVYRFTNAFFDTICFINTNSITDSKNMLCTNFNVWSRAYCLL